MSGELFLIVLVFVVVYAFGCKKAWMVEHFWLKLFLPDWFFRFIGNYSFLGLRKFMKLNFIMLVFWYVPTLAWSVCILVGETDLFITKFDASIYGILKPPESFAFVMSFLLQYFSLNVFGIWLGYQIGDLHDYSIEIWQAVYSIPAIKQSISSKDPNIKTKLEVKKRSTTDYVILTNAFVSLSDFVSNQDKIQNKIAKAFSIIKIYQEENGLFVIRIGKLKTKTVSDGYEKFRVSDVQQQDLSRYKINGKPSMDAMNIVAMGHDGVDTVFHDMRVDPTVIMSGIRRSGKTNLATHAARELYRIKAPFLYAAAIDIIKMGLHWNLAQYNYFDLIQNDNPATISDKVLYQRMKSARRNKNFSLTTDEDGFIRLVKAIEIELELRSRFLTKFPNCTKWQDLMRPGTGVQVPPPEILLIADEWSIMAEQYWKDKGNNVVAEAMNKFINFVSTAANRGIYIIFMAQKIRIEEFKQARDQCKFYYGSGTTVREMGYTADVEASKPPNIRGAFTHIDESNFGNRGVGMFCTPEVRPLDFCEMVTLAADRFHPHNKSWLYDFRARLISNVDETIMRKVNLGQMELLSV